MVTLDPQVQIAMLATFATLATQIMTMIKQIHDRKADKKERVVIAEKVDRNAASIARKVDTHNEVVSEKLDVNTQLTIEAKETSHQAIAEANNFNRKIENLQADVHGKLGSLTEEVSRVAHNVHALRNTLQEITGKEVPFEKKKEPPKRPSGYE